CSFRSRRCRWFSRRWRWSLLRRRGRPLSKRGRRVPLQSPRRCPLLRPGRVRGSGRISPRTTSDRGVLLAPVVLAAVGQGTGGGGREGACSRQWTISPAPIRIVVVKVSVFSSV